MKILAKVQGKNSNKKPETIKNKILTPEISPVREPKDVEFTGKLFNQQQNSTATESNELITYEGISPRREEEDLSIKQSPLKRVKLEAEEDDVSLFRSNSNTDEQIEVQTISSVQDSILEESEENNQELLIENKFDEFKLKLMKLEVTLSKVRRNNKQVIHHGSNNLNKNSSNIKENKETGSNTLRFQDLANFFKNFPMTN